MNLINFFEFFDVFFVILPLNSIDALYSGFPETEKKSGVLFTLLQYSEQPTNPNICFEALQVMSLEN